MSLKNRLNKEWFWRHQILSDIESANDPLLDFNHYVSGLIIFAVTSAGINVPISVPQSAHLMIKIRSVGQDEPFISMDHSVTKLDESSPTVSNSAPLLWNKERNRKVIYGKIKKISRDGKKDSEKEKINHIRRKEHILKWKNTDEQSLEEKNLIRRKKIKFSRTGSFLGHTSKR